MRYNSCGMANLIKCPHCNQSFEPTAAFKHELEETLLKETQARHKEEIESVKKEALEFSNKQLSELMEKQKKMDEEHKLELEKARMEAGEKVNKDLRDKEEQILELRKRAEQAEEQELQIRKEKRLLDEEKRRFELDKQRQLDEEREKIRDKAMREVQESFELKDKEKEMVIDSLKKALAEAQRKAQQGSQQAQGEALELNFEQMLRDNFANDEIEPVEKGVRGADVRQVVKSPKGFVCGVILWETKRTKAWSDGWIDKLKSDLRAEKANIPVIVSTVLPKDFDKDMGLKDGVWICNFPLAIPMAQLLRKSLLDVGYQKAVSAYRGEKADRLYEFITSHEFRHQVEAMLEVYAGMKVQITRERVAYEKMWKSREKQVDQLLSSTANIVGGITGEVGQSAFQIKGLDLPALEGG